MVNTALNRKVDIHQGLLLNMLGLHTTLNYSSFLHTNSILTMYGSSWTNRSVIYQRS